MKKSNFFKNLDASIFTPLFLTSLYIPGLIIQLLPFIIFITSLKFIVDIRNSRDLLTLKILGYSNFKIFFVFAFTSFLLGWMILFFMNPITSIMSKYYEKTKGNYSKDIDHLATFNKNGLWIKESIEGGQRIISASSDQKNKLKDLLIILILIKLSFKLEKDSSVKYKRIKLIRKLICFGIK